MYPTIRTIYKFLRIKKIVFIFCFYYVKNLKLRKTFFFKGNITIYEDNSVQLLSYFLIYFIFIKFYYT